MGNAPENAGRKQGQFRKGQSGNPRGKLKGTRNRATRLAEALLEDEAVGLMRQAVDLAKAGDVTALRLCIERLVPKRTERPIYFEMPSISTPNENCGRAVPDHGRRRAATSQNAPCLSPELKA